MLSEAVRFLHGDPRNNGPGVADQERIFDAFGYYEDKWNGDRLAVSRSIVEAHGGPALGRE